MEPYQLRDGEYKIAVLGDRNNTVFEFEVYAPAQSSKLAGDDLTAVQALYDDCCIGSNGFDGNATVPICSTILPKALAPNRPITDDLCHVAPNVCNACGKLVQLVLGDGGLRCSKLPATMAKLTDLETLDLAGNQVSDSSLAGVMATLAPLSKLRRLFLRDLGLTGTIPCTGLAILPALRILSFSQNRLTGSIPSCLMEHPALEELFLSFNGLTGTVPPLRADSKLRLFFAINQTGTGLSGPLPASLASAPNLHLLDVSGNSLTGPLPPFPPAIKYFNASYNSITGPLPDLPASMQQLDVSDNRLNGALPANLSASTELVYFIASNNRLVSTASLAKTALLTILPASAFLRLGIA